MSKSKLLSLDKMTTNKRSPGTDKGLKQETKETMSMTGKRDIDSESDKPSNLLFTLIITHNHL